jgi:hypothetical protein
VTVQTNDLKADTEVALANGCLARLVDNRKGAVRLAMVKGQVEEVGSVYAHDIVKAKVNGIWEVVEHTPAQHKLREVVRSKRRQYGT